MLIQEVPSKKVSKQNFRSRQGKRRSNRKVGPFVFGGTGVLQYAPTKYIIDDPMKWQNCNNGNIAMKSPAEYDSEIWLI